MNAFSQQRRRMRLGLAAVFGLLALAAAYLIYFSFGQLRYEAFYDQRNLAEAFVTRVGQTLADHMAREADRVPAEYDFLIDDGKPYSQLSPLASLTVGNAVPGTLGYFQVDASGQFSTPLLPSEANQIDAVGFSAGELNARKRVQQDLREVLVKAEPAAPADVKGDVAPQAKRLQERAVVANQKIFSDLSRPQPSSESSDYVSSVGQVGELKLKASRADAPVAGSKQRLEEDNDGGLRAAAPSVAEGEAITLNDEQRLNVFNDTINQLRLSVLDDQHIAFHRDVWLQGERRVQGFVVKLEEFLRSIVARQFQSDRVSQSNDLAIALGSEIVMLLPAVNRAAGAISTDDVTGNELVLRRGLPAPAHEFDLLISTQALPSSAGTSVLTYTGMLLLVLLVAGYVLLSRLTAKSIDLAQQQQDFVSAVTHELKTPLTSIRMYGEILRAGWADEEKRRRYYDFIYHESERLSRLINNVLQLARITRGSSSSITLEDQTVSSLVEGVRTVTEGAFESSGFELECAIEPGVEDASVLVDPDGFQQVMVNLVDNALKFAKDSEPKRVIVGARKHRESVDFFVRDFGPGIPPDQLKKIFELFYRGEDELTRETVGTGIGLALVAELVGNMHGQIDVINQSPGSEFIVRIKRAEGH
jgi:signal transduction histidine kinase